MSFPLATAVKYAVSINRFTSAVGATLFVVAGIYQLYQQIKHQRRRR
jgi:hypothetical protein